MASAGLLLRAREYLNGACSAQQIWGRAPPRILGREQQPGRAGAGEEEDAEEGGEGDTEEDGDELISVQNDDGVWGEQSLMGDAGVITADGCASAANFERPRGGGASRIGSVGHHHPEQYVTEEEAEELRAAGYDV